MRCTCLQLIRLSMSVPFRVAFKAPCHLVTRNAHCHLIMRNETRRLLTCNSIALYICIEDGCVYNICVYVYDIYMCVHVCVCVVV